MGTTLEIQLSRLVDPESGDEFSRASDRRFDDWPAELPVNLPAELPVNSPVKWPINGSEDWFHQIISQAFARAHLAADALSFFSEHSLLSKFNRGELECGVATHEVCAAETRSEDRTSSKSDSVTHATMKSASEFLENESLAPSSERSPQLEVFERTLRMAQSLALKFPKGFLLNAAGGPDVDLSGIAKGAVVDEVYQALAELLGDWASQFEWSVNAGGDLRVSGISSVEVRAPSENAEEKRYNLQMLGSAVATSSHQGLNMAVGTPAGKYSSEFIDSSLAATVSVIAQSCVAADAFAKIAFQYDLGGTLSAREAEQYGLLAVLNFDRSGELISAHEWNV